MRTRVNRLLLLSLMAGIMTNMSAPVPANASQEIKETLTISRFLDDHYRDIRAIKRHANEMKKQASPFDKSEKHRSKFRFEPGDGHARTIMTLTREMASRLKLVNGILYHSDVANKDMIYKESLETVDSIATYAKRAVRANKDNNYALYLASAQGIEKDLVNLNRLLDELETGINDSIAESDARKEAL